MIAAHLSLLDVMSIQMGCGSLSDLQFLSDGQRALLARKLEQVAANADDLQDWNDALDYLAQAPPERTAQAAKERLIDTLSHPR